MNAKTKVFHVQLRLKSGGKQIEECLDLMKLTLVIGMQNIEDLNRPTQLLNATGIVGGIHNGQVLNYQPSVTSRLIFWYLMITNGIK